MRGVLNFDGGCLPRNPGGVATWGFVLQLPHIELRQHGVAAPPGPDSTNNVAEYHGLLRGLESARANGVTDIVVRGDSELVVRQLLGRYQVRAARLRPLHAQARALLAMFDRVNVEWVPRARNADADRETELAYEEHVRAARSVRRTP